MRQLTFHDGSEAREEGIDKVERHADLEFLDVMYRAGQHLARKGGVFTSADMRDLVTKHYPEVRTHDERAIGAVLRSLRRDGVIEPTGQYVNQKRRRNHCRPLREWHAGPRAQ